MGEFTVNHLPRPMAWISSAGQDMVRLVLWWRRGLGKVLKCISLLSSADNIPLLDDPRQVDVSFPWFHGCPSNCLQFHRKYRN